MTSVTITIRKNKVINELGVLKKLLLVSCIVNLIIYVSCDTQAMKYLYINQPLRPKMQIITGNVVGIYFLALRLIF
jgi:hypothetical protein